MRNSSKPAQNWSSTATWGRPRRRPPTYSGTTTTRWSTTAQTRAGSSGHTGRAGAPLSLWVQTCTLSTEIMQKSWKDTFLEEIQDFLSYFHRIFYMKIFKIFHDPNLDLLGLVRWRGELHLLSPQHPPSLRHHQHHGHGGQVRRRPQGRPQLCPGPSAQTAGGLVLSLCADVLWYVCHVMLPSWPGDLQIIVVYMRVPVIQNNILYIWNMWWLMRMM